MRKFIFLGICFFALMTLCDAGAQSRSEYLSDHLGDSALAGDLRSVKSLLAKGAPVNLTGVQKGGDTALMGAARAGRGEAGNFDDLQPGREAELRRLRPQYENIVKLLIRKGADVNARYEPYKPHEIATTPLMEATAGQSPVIVKLLLAQGARVNDKDDEGRTALMRASRLDSLEVVKILVAHGARINDQNKKGYTALMAASLNSPRIARYLLSKGATVNAKTKSGVTAFILAADAYRVTCTGQGVYPLSLDYPDKHEMFRLLLSKGANINAQTKSGTTALLRAVHISDFKTVRFLLAQRANPNIKDRTQGTPLTLAKRLVAVSDIYNGFYNGVNAQKIVALLENTGAK